MRECFVIMPIGSGDAYQVYRNRYDHIIRPAVDDLRIDGERAFRCVRADFVTKTGSITRDLLGRLYRSDTVIADLTDLNPNVFYELGVRHALRAGTILIALKGTRPPFDVGDLRVIPYEDRVGGEKEAVPQIREMLKSLLADDRPQDSPVLHAIPELAELGAVKEHEARVAALLHERDLLTVQLEVSEKATLANQKQMYEVVEQLSKGAKLTVYDDLLARFGTETELPLRGLVANALFNKGVTLGALDRRAEAIAVYDDLLARFGTATELPLREQVANAESSRQDLQKSCRPGENRAREDSGAA